MRLGVLDVGSNTVHLLVVDAHRERTPVAGVLGRRSVLRLAERIGPDGAIDADAADALVEAVAAARGRRSGTAWHEMRGVRHLRRARRRPTRREVLDRVRAETGVRLRGALRRGRGTADLPRGTPVVRLVGRAVAGARHRRRLAGARRRHRRGAGGGAVAAAGRGAADPRLRGDHAPTARTPPRRAWPSLCRRRPRWRGCASSSWPPSPRWCRGSRRWAGTARRHLEDVPDAGPAGRRGAVSARASGVPRTPDPGRAAPGARLHPPHPAGGAGARWTGSARAGPHQLLAGAVVAEVDDEPAWAWSAVEICPWALREGVILAPPPPRASSAMSQGILRGIWGESSPIPSPDGYPG